MNKVYLAVLLLLIGFTAFPQQYTISGKVTDRQTGETLSYANIKVLNSLTGTAANSKGDYSIKLAEGEYVLTASYIGYYSDTVSVKLEKNLKDINFYLNQTNLNLPEVVVTPGNNPANEIIRKAIEKKNKRNEYLMNYEFEAYTKGVVKTNQDLSAGSNSIGVSIGSSDTTELQIAGILENHSRAYYQYPDKYKEVILARKQSANFPPNINILTGGRLIQNFYANDVSFFGRDIPGPVSDNALNYYYYYVERTLALDNKPVYQIFMAPDKSNYPGFIGSIFISDSTFDLIKVNLRLNRAANPGGIFDTINIFQQFAEYGNVYMPVDYRLFVTANVLGLARIGFDLNTILFDYKINDEIDPEIFDKAVVTVLPDADKKDNLYWLTTQTIPNTLEEEKAYRRIDSLENVPRKFLDDFSFLNSRLSLNKNISVSGPLSLYHFNRVEGNALDFGVFVDDAYDQRFNSSLGLSYGFSDKKFKYDFSGEYLLGDYRTFNISAGAFNKINVLFNESDNYTEILSTLLTLISKYEFRNYYYSNGFNINISGEVLPVLTLSAGFKNKTDNSAINNSDFSFFNTDKSYSINPPIYETKINAITAGFKFDFRNYIEDGYFRRRTSFGNSYFLLSGNVSYSNNSLISTGLDFTKYDMSFSAFVRTFNSATLNLKLFGIYNSGTLPYQDLYALPGNIDVISKPNSFRTLNPNEIIGEKIFTAYFNHDFRDEIFRWLNIPGIKEWEILLTTFFNVAVADIGNKSQAILPAQIKTFPKPFYEIGFGLGQGIIPFKIEFAWKLNYRDGNNFRISLNTPVL